MVKNAIGMYQKKEFKLTKFISNSREILTRHHQKIKDQDLNIGDLPVERALGVHWNIENDYLNFKIKDNPLTRREMLPTTSSAYDPHHLFWKGKKFCGNSASLKLVGIKK